MEIPSLARSPTALVRFNLSEPAKSTKWNLLTRRCHDPLSVDVRLVAEEEILSVPSRGVPSTGFPSIDSVDPSPAFSSDGVFGVKLCCFNVTEKIACERDDETFISVAPVVRQRDPF